MHGDVGGTPVAQRLEWLRLIPAEAKRAGVPPEVVLAVIEVARDQVQVSVPLTAFSEGRPFSISDPLLGVA